MPDRATHLLATKSTTGGDSAVSPVPRPLVGLDQANEGPTPEMHYAWSPVDDEADHARSIIICCPRGPAVDSVSVQGPGATLCDVTPPPDNREPDRDADGPPGGPQDTPPAPTALPARRPDLLLRPLGDKGRYVVKDPRTGAYFTLGEQEYFLLCQLDGVRSARAVCQAFEERFGEPLSEEDLDGFLALARGRGFLADPAVAPRADEPPPARRQSLLYWRVSLFDPNRLFDRMAPRLSFLWTRSFLVVSAAAILLAVVLAWAGRDRLVASFAHAFRWETVLLVWLTLVVATFCHEFAHGLTCKHHGGEVHEVGFLAMYFLPCFYCNVSDAWLFKEKSKRLWVTLAGGYCDLCLWALAVFAWRLSAPDGRLNYIAWVVLSVLGARVFFNFNPLLKLDGYYLLSDWLEVPNLRQRAWERLAGWVRWLLWGAARPGPAPRSRFLLTYGLTSWLFSLAFLALMVAGFYQFLGSRWGLVGAAAAVLLGVVSVRGLFYGFGGGEVRNMFLLRRKRTVVWLLLLGGLAAWLALGEMDARVSGAFEVRPAARAEVRAPVAGFLREVYREEGQRAYPGEVVALLEVPDLASRLRQQQAAVREDAARLALLRQGPRPEEVEEQRGRVDRARAWRDRAAGDLERSRKAYAEELTLLDRQIDQHRAEKDHAEEIMVRVRRLLGQQVLAQQEFADAKKMQEVATAKQEQAKAQRRAREALGTQEAEGELARRDKELADARAALRLLESWPRPREIEAAEARLARLQEEVRYLEDVQRRLRVVTPVGGLVSTPRLKEKVGQYLREGDLICVVEEPAGLEVELTVDESDVGRVCPGQVVELKCRAFPLEMLTARVDRVAPRASRTEPPTTAPSSARGEFSSTQVVYCRLEGADPGLRPGMTGQARVCLGRGRVWEVLSDRVLRYFRSELWW